MSNVRTRIDSYVQDNPGIHFNALVRELDLAAGQTQYHVRRLLRAGELEQAALYGRTHYYPPEYDEWERGAIALLRRETARAIVLGALDRDEPRPASLADELDLARSTLEWHLSNLVEQGVVEKRYDDRGRVTLTVPRPAATERLLDAVAPSTTDRLVDRFTAFVDRALEGGERDHSG